MNRNRHLNRRFRKLSIVCDITDVNKLHMYESLYYINTISLKLFWKTFFSLFHKIWIYTHVLFDVNIL